MINGRDAQAFRRLLTAVDKACVIIETGDQRLLASDGPVTNQPPELSLIEWRELYTALDKARRYARAFATIDRNKP